MLSNLTSHELPWKLGSIGHHWLQHSRQSISKCLLWIAGFHKAQDLIRDWDHDGLSLGVVKAVHRLDITKHVEASGEDDKQQKSSQQADPDGHSEEPYAVPGWTEGAVVDCVIEESFHLENIANFRWLSSPSHVVSFFSDNAQRWEPPCLQKMG